MANILDFDTDNSPTDDDYVWGYDHAAGTEKKIPISDLAEPIASSFASESIPSSAIADMGYVEIGRTTLGVAGDTISVTGIPARKYLLILVSTIPTGGTTVHFLTFNNDSGANYATRFSDSGAADSIATSQSNFAPIPETAATRGLCVMEIDNISAQEKIGFVRGMRNTAGAATAPGSRREGVCKWANTSAQINRIDITNTGTGDFAIGSEVVVLGRD